MIKNLILLTLALACFSVSLAQTQLYTNQPAQTKLYAGLYGSVYTCIPDADVHVYADNSLYPFADGVKLALRIDSIASFPAGTISSTFGIISVGDTLVFDSANTIHSFFFPAGGTVYFDVVTVGTPTQAGQEYYCTLQADVTLGFCNNSYWIYPDTSQTCSVQVGNAVDEGELNAWEVGPVPAHDILRASGSGFWKRGSLIDLKGQKVITLENIDNKNVLELNISTVVPGIYLLEIEEENGRFLKKVLIE